MDRIGDNGVSLEFSRILQLLNSSQLFQKLHSGRTIKQLLPNDTTSKSMGFISQISRILVAFDDGSRIPIIVKIPELHTITHSMVLICGEKERNFMRENGKATAYATEPWRYGDASSCGSVIMRDLSAQAEPSNIYNGLNPSQLLEILSQIAWIQVHGLRSKTPYIRLSDGYMEFFYKMQEPASTWTTLEPKIGPEFEKIQHLYKNRHFWHYVFRESHKDLGIPDVICHGDMWAYNFLWNKTGKMCITVIFEY
ncbi:unnamed protein product, partial [Mesorhabditis belari]|uniref:CHK kinase-like domain-containing protein n=1 Tax=Mesorhabditis belari TaxID=2138241 RepID=A0AAF3F8H4_9BILA